MTTPGTPANPLVDTYPFCGACGWDVSTLNPNLDGDTYCDACGADLAAFWNSLTPPTSLAATPSTGQVSFGFTVNSAADSTQSSESDDDLVTWSDFATDTSPTVIANTVAGTIVGIRVRSVVDDVYGPELQLNSGVPISAALTGTAIAGGVLESEIVTGGETIIITLTNDTWVATAGDDNAITNAIIAGILSAQSEAAGWNVEVIGNMVFGDVARTSSTVVTVTLAAEAAYAITADETITVTIPATALTAAGAEVAAPTFDVTAA